MVRHSERRGAGWRVAGLAVLGVLGPLVLSGCSRPPQISEANREILLALATATSSQDVALLERCAAQVAAQQDSGTLPAAEFAAFTAILDQARAGGWDEARAAAYALRDAQRPTAETLEAVRNRTVRAAKRPGL